MGVSQLLIGNAPGPAAVASFRLPGAPMRGIVASQYPGVVWYARVLSAPIPMKQSRLDIIARPNRTLSVSGKDKPVADAAAGDRG